MPVLTWNQFTDAEPALAEAGRALLYQFGVGLAFLGTVRADGGPRLHPVCPIVSGGLYGLIIPSPKLADLRRDPRVALHTFPSAENEDAFYLVGQIETRADSGVRDVVEQTFLSERNLDAAPPGLEDHELVEFLIESCLLTRTTGHSDFAPQHQVWRADAG